MNDLLTPRSHAKSLIAAAAIAWFSIAVSAQDPVAGDSTDSPSERAQAADSVTEEALLELRQAVENDLESSQARISLARALALLRRDSEAIEQYERAAEIDAANAAARIGLGDIYLAQGNLDKALVHLRAAVELDPKAERPRLAETQALYAQGRFEEVLERLEEAHEALPTSGLVAYGLTWMLAASPDASLRDGERALFMAEAVFESHQSIPNAELVAEALAELDRCSKAVEWLEGIATSVVEPGAPPEIVDRLQRGVDRFSQGPPCRAAAQAP